MGSLASAPGLGARREPDRLQWSWLAGLVTALQAEAGGDAGTQSWRRNLS